MSVELILGITTGVLTLISGILAKLHISRSSCNENGGCISCNMLCQKDEIDGENETTKISGV